MTPDVQTKQPKLPRWIQLWRQVGIIVSLTSLPAIMTMETDLSFKDLTEPINLYFVLLGLLVCLPWSRIKTASVWWIAYCLLIVCVGILVATFGWISCSDLYDPQTSMTFGSTAFSGRGVAVFFMLLFLPYEIVLVMQVIVIWRMRKGSQKETMSARQAGDQ